MKFLNKKVTGILLSGGMSRRMGRQKGSMEIGGRMLYEYPLKALESVCDEILISGSSPLPGQLRYPLVRDIITGIGPMGGIHACLGHSSNDLNLVLSYDLPMINDGLLSFLVEQSDEWDLLVPAIKSNKPEPLCAIYRKSLKPVFEAMIEQERYAVNQVISQVRSKVLSIHEGMPFYHADLFLNINRADDLKRLPEDFGSGL